MATLGYVWKQFKIDGSIFTGREPDQSRWNFDRPRFDSYSGRLTYNPTKAWSMQVSYGNLHSPEQLDPGVDVQRVTASVSYHHAWEQNNWQTTFAWGRNINDPGNALDGFLLESLVNFRNTHTVFVRAERVDKNELFPPGNPRAGQEFTVNKVSLGYIYDFPKWKHATFGIGGLGAIHVVPDSLTSAYGDTPLSFMLFVRAKLWANQDEHPAFVRQTTVPSCCDATDQRLRPGQAEIRAYFFRCSCSASKSTASASHQEHRQ